MDNENISPRLAYTISEASEYTGLSRNYIHRLCNAGHLTRRKVGKRTFILAEDLVAFLRSRDSRKWAVAQPVHEKGA